MGCRILSVNCNGFKSFVPLLNNVLSTCDLYAGTRVIEPGVAPIE